MIHSYNNKVITLSGTTLKYSENAGLSFNAGVNLSGILTLKRGRILSNGVILITDGKTKLYYSDDNLTSVKQCIVKGLDGQDYVLHTPVNEALPGTYYDWFSGFVDTGDKFVFGNYSNSGSGASPANLYYSLNGTTWKVFYQFGQNAEYKDDGSVFGGITGNLLGNTNNPIITRHTHAINIGYDGNLYTSHGDGLNEMHMLKLVYNKVADTWTITDLLSGNSISMQRFRSLGTYERNGYIYWGGDGSGNDVVDGVYYSARGIFKAALSDLNDIKKHIRVSDENDAVYTFLNVDNIVFAGYQTVQKINISTDWGETWRAFNKPAYMPGATMDVYYNRLYRYFKATRPAIMQIKPINV